MSRVMNKKDKSIEQNASVPKKTNGTLSGEQEVAKEG